MADVPSASFLNFLSGLGSQALMQFGEIPDPVSGRRSLNVPLAPNTVQLLEVLRAKSEGNRTPEEDRYLVALLADLSARLARLPDGPGDAPQHEGPAGEKH